MLNKLRAALRLLPNNPSFEFVGKRNITLAISAIMLLIATVALP